MAKRILFLLALGFSFFYYSCSKHSDIVITSYSDGPYIIHKSDSSMIIFQNQDYSFDSVFVANSNLEGITFKCYFDSIDCPAFDFQLSHKEIGTKDSISLPEKLIAISDIEGNFEKFYQLLVSNNVMDTNYNWTFGEGHLIIIGDLVDRGNYVTQCLWLVYHLEDEANKHGGEVHYLLGNHEQLILLGYNNYCAPKYIQNYAELDIDDISQIYGTNTELGKWIRERPAILKTGDFIFVHAGISPSLLNYDLPLDKINSEIKRDIATMDFQTDESLELLTEYGILWYRGFVEPSEEYEKITEEELDKILHSYNCKAIVIGHTPVDSISQDFQGKVIRIDIDHYENSSALLIENGTKYVVDYKGNRTILE